jgi:hypothetical protein
MKPFVVWTATLVWIAAGASMLTAGPAGCPANLPAGTIIRMFPDEKLLAGATSGPIIFTVGSDVQFFPNRPPMLPRGSKILGQVAESEQGGRVWGKARAHIVLTSILTADCEYPIDAKILEAGRFNVEDNVVQGRGHTKRDAFLLLFPPTTLYQLIRIPGRGPKLVLDAETPLTIKLMQAIYPEDALSSSSPNELSALHTKVDQLERHVLSLEAAIGSRASRSSSNEPRDEPRPLFSAPCPAASVPSPARPIAYREGVLRPVRNLTPYHVRLFMNGAQVANLPPCYNSMVMMPAYPFHLESVASLLTSEGQTQMEVKTVSNIDENGWDIVWDIDQPVPVSTNR